MIRLFENWRRLSIGRQAIALAAAAGLFAALFVLGKAATTPRMTLLYSGLEPSIAGETLTAIEAMNIRAEVRGDAIYVPESQRDALRMALAREGLPGQAQAGFELLDEINGLATTADMFDATYWRAKEGELARSILTTPGVKSVRVHIAAPRRSAFSRDAGKPRAAVTVGMGRGPLSIELAEAMRTLVALAVPNLDPSQVAVIDAARGVVLGPEEPDLARTLAHDAVDRASAIERDIVDLLEARVGRGNVRVEASVALSREHETVSERIINPQARVLVSKDSNEIAETGTGPSGAVTVASNLPEGDAAPPPSSRHDRSEASENTRYDVSETKRETVSTPGGEKRVQVAVLLNEPVGADGAATPRSPAEIDQIRRLVAAAIGFDEQRGDVITVESLRFEADAAAGALVEKPTIMDFLAKNAIAIMQIVVPAIVALLLGLFVVRPLLAGASTPATTPALSSSAPTTPALEKPATPAIASPVDDLKRVASDQRGAAANVLKDWLEAPDAA